MALALGAVVSEFKMPGFLLDECFVDEACLEKTLECAIDGNLVEAIFA